MEGTMKGIGIMKCKYTLADMTREDLAHTLDVLMNKAEHKKRGMFFYLEDKFTSNASIRITAQEEIAWFSIEKNLYDGAYRFYWFYEDGKKVIEIDELIEKLWIYIQDYQ